MNSGDFFDPKKWVFVNRSLLRLSTSQNPSVQSDKSKRLTVTYGNDELLASGLSDQYQYITTVTLGENKNIFLNCVLFRFHPWPIVTCIACLVCCKLTCLLLASLRLGQSNIHAEEAVVDLSFIGSCARQLVSEKAATAEADNLL